MANNTLFQLSQISEDIENTPLFSEIENLFANATCLDDIIKGWMDKEKMREISFVSGISEDPDTLDEPFVYAIIEQADQEYAIAECSKKALLELNPNLVLVSNSSFDFNNEDCSCNDDWFEERNQGLGIIFDEDFCEHQIPRANVEKLVLSYLLSDLPTEAELFFVSDESLDDIDSYTKDQGKEGIPNRNYVCINLIAQEVKDDGGAGRSSGGEFVSFFL